MTTPKVSLANYSPYRRAGDLVFFSGLIAVDGTDGRLICGYEDLVPEERVLAGEIGQVSIDAINGPMAAQTWFIYRTLESLLQELGGSLEDVVHLNQYFTDVREFPTYSEVRDKFFPVAPASTVLEVSRMLPSPKMRIEIQATAYLPVAGENR